jgi:lysophospholipid acyltransferase (LPLAT)-like uncharacterized protein
MMSSRRLLGAPWVQTAIGVTAAGYLRLVRNTTRFAPDEPADIYDSIARDSPVILAMWHGQHFLTPFLRRPEHRVKVLVSRHRDGEINAIAAERLGVGTIRGSGDHGTGFARKGGVSAFTEMLDALAAGFIIAITADVPRVARVAGRGIVKLAQRSGRPIYPVAIATRRRHVLDNWDRTTINLPFGHGARVAGPPVRVAADADDAALEAARREVEASLNAATRRAYDIADGGAARITARD